VALQRSPSKSTRKAAAQLGIGATNIEKWFEFVSIQNVSVAYTYSSKQAPKNGICWMGSWFGFLMRHTSTWTVLTYLLTHGAERFLRSCQLCSHSRKSQRFMEPEGSLPPSQEPSTGPYPEPDRSNPHHSILSL
jgi:hypothetical protein